MSNNIDLCLMFIIINIFFGYILLFNINNTALNNPKLRVKTTLLNDTLNDIDTKIKLNESFSLFCLQINNLRTNNLLECDNLINKYTDLYSSYTEVFNLSINELRHYIMEKVMIKYPNSNITSTFKNCCKMYHVKLLK
jgi:hypothetical protein